MTIKATPVTSWKRVINAARFTQGKDPIDKEPSDKWKKQALFSEHSPIRLLEFDIQIYGAPYASVMHLVRHFIGVVPFVHTSRPDITGEPVTRHEQRKDDPTDVQFSINAQALINMSQFRLCTKAEAETRNIWALVRDAIKEVDPVMASVMVPRCIAYNGMCKEAKPCGINKSMFAQDLIREYKQIPE